MSTECQGECDEAGYLRAQIARLTEELGKQRETRESDLEVFRATVRKLAKELDKARQAVQSAGGHGPGQDAPGSGSIPHQGLADQEGSSPSAVGAPIEVTGSVAASGENEKAADSTEGNNHESSPGKARAPIEIRVGQRWRHRSTHAPVVRVAAADGGIYKWTLEVEKTGDVCRVSDQWFANAILISEGES